MSQSQQIENNNIFFYNKNNKACENLNSRFCKQDF